MKYYVLKSDMVNRPMTDSSKAEQADRSTVTCESRWLLRVCPSTFLPNKAHTFTIGTLLYDFSHIPVVSCFVGTSVVDLGTMAVLSCSSDDRPSAHLAIRLAFQAHAPINVSCLRRGLLLLRKATRLREVIRASRPTTASVWFAALRSASPDGASKATGRCMPHSAAVVAAVLERVIFRQ